MNHERDINSIDARDCRLANALDWGALHGLEHHEAEPEDDVRREQLAILYTTAAFLALIAGSLTALSHFG